MGQIIIKGYFRQFRGRRTRVQGHHIIKQAHWSKPTWGMPRWKTKSTQGMDFYTSSTLKRSTQGVSQWITKLAIRDSITISLIVSPNVLTLPPQLQFETYLCELCGNNAHYGYDCSPQFPFVYEQEPCYNQNFNDNYFPQNSQSSSQQYLCCAYCGGPHFDYQCQPINETYYEPNPSYDSSGFDQPQPPQDSVDHQRFLQALDKIQEELEEIKRDRRKKIEDMSIEEMRHEQQLVDYKIKDITNDLGYKRFRGEKIDEEYERDCEIRIQKLKQDFNEWGSEVRKKEQAYNEEQYSAARRRMLSIPFVDEDDYIPLRDTIARYSTSKAITSDLPTEEPEDSLIMREEALSTIPKKDKSSVENLVPIPSGSEGLSKDTRDVPTCDNNRVNVESDLVESLINRDTSIVYSSKIDPILEEFAGELAHIAPIPPGIVEADFDPNDDTSSDDDSFENIEYVDASPSYSELVSLEKVNDVDQEEKEFDLEDIFQIQDVNLREKLLKISRLITNIEALKDNPNPIPVTDRLTNNSNDPEFESFHFDLKPSSPRPSPKPPDVCLSFKPNLAMKNVFVKLNEDFYQREKVLSLNVEDVDSFTFIIWTFLTYPEASPLSCSTGSEDTIFDPGIVTFHVSYLKPVTFLMEVFRICSP
ncbi:hypothetical protein Tco_1212917 [Tanacetum coccineum]